MSMEIKLFSPSLIHRHALFLANLIYLVVLTIYLRGGYERLAVCIEIEISNLSLIMYFHSVVNSLYTRRCIYRVIHNQSGKINADPIPIDNIPTGLGKL